jgi:uncharacterized protein (UPF0335 family)
MKIVLFTIPEETASLHIMCKDMLAEMKAQGYDVVMTSNMSELPVLRPDLLVNFSVKDILNIQRAAGRWWYCDKLVNTFTMSCETYYRAMMAGFLASILDTPMIAISQAIKDDILNRGREMFNAATMRTIAQNTHMINYGVLDCYKFTKKQNLDAFIAPITRLAEDKRFSDHQEATIRTMALFHMKKMAPRTAIYLTMKLSLSKFKKLTTDGYDVKEIILDRKVYAEELQKYAFSICTCDFESFGLYYIELLLSGVIVIFADYPWVHKLLPNYKYVCKLDELPGLALHLRKNYDEAFAYIEKEVIPFIRENYLIGSFVNKFMQLMPTLERGVGLRYKDTI